MRVSYYDVSKGSKIYFGITLPRGCIESRKRGSSASRWDKDLIGIDVFAEGNRHWGKDVTCITTRQLVR